MLGAGGNGDGQARARRCGRRHPRDVTRAVRRPPCGGDGSVRVPARGKPARSPQGRHRAAGARVRTRTRPARASLLRGPRGSAGADAAGFGLPDARGACLRCYARADASARESAEPSPRAGARSRCRSGPGGGTRRGSPRWRRNRPAHQSRSGVLEHRAVDVGAPAGRAGAGDQRGRRRGVQREQADPGNRGERMLRLGPGEAARPVGWRGRAAAPDDRDDRSRVELQPARPGHDPLRLRPQMGDLRRHRALGDREQARQIEERHLQVDRRRRVVMPRIAAGCSPGNERSNRQSRRQIVARLGPVLPRGHDRPEQGPSRFGPAGHDQQVAEIVACRGVVGSHGQDAFEGRPGLDDAIQRSCRVATPIPRFDVIGGDRQGPIEARERFGRALRRGEDMTEARPGLGITWCQRDRPPQSGFRRRPVIESAQRAAGQPPRIGIAGGLGRMLIVEARRQRRLACVVRGEPPLQKAPLGRRELRLRYHAKTSGERPSSVPRVLRTTKSGAGGRRRVQRRSALLAPARPVRRSGADVTPRPPARARSRCRSAATPPRAGRPRPSSHRDGPGGTAASADTRACRCAGPANASRPPP